MSAQLSEVKFYNKMTGGKATSATQGSIQYMNSVMGTNYGSREVAEKAYFEYLAANPPTPITPTDVVVSDGDTLNTEDGGSVAVAVANGVATYTYTAP